MITRSGPPLRAGPAVAGLTVAGLAVAGCGGGGTDVGPPPVTAGCRNAMTDAAAEPDPADADRLRAVTLEYCINVGEWGTAFFERPTARSGLGLPADADITELMQIICPGAETASLCLDAAERGMLG